MYKKYCCTLTMSALPFNIMSIFTHELFPLNTFDITSFQSYCKAIFVQKIDYLILVQNIVLC
jgi:hypothetical protein